MNTKLLFKENYFFIEKIGQLWKSISDPLISSRVLIRSFTVNISIELCFKMPPKADDRKMNLDVFFIRNLCLVTFVLD